MLNAVIVGAGHRALGYAKYAELHPDRLRVVGVADLFPERRQAVARLYSLPPEHCFESLDAMLAHGRIADVAINGTMDHQHVATTIPLLETGYDVLLEKPFAVNAGELRKLAEGVHKTGHKVMICHVLRYAPFYREIKARIAAGAVGEIIDIQTAEHVSYHHFSACYVRDLPAGEVQPRPGSDRLAEERHPPCFRRQHGESPVFYPEKCAGAFRDTLSAGLSAGRYLRFLRETPASGSPCPLGGVHLAGAGLPPGTQYAGTAESRLV